MLPTNNAQLLADPNTAKDRFFFSAILQQVAAGYVLNIPAGGPVIAQNEADVAAAHALPRKAWDNSEKRANLPGVTTDMRMIGAGGIVSVRIGDEEPRTVLFEKTAGPSKGRMAQASGLSDQNPLHALWEEMAEETGIMTVDRDTKTLSLIVIEPKGLDRSAFASEAEQSAFLRRQEQAKQSQFQTLREQLPEEMKDWNIVTERKSAEPNPEDDRYLDAVRIILPDGQVTEARVLVSDSEKTANVNLLMPVILDFPAGTELVILDPEEFKRPVQTFTRSEMLTPEFRANKASVPMFPYLEKVAAVELNPAPSAGPDLSHLSL